MLVYLITVLTIYVRCHEKMFVLALENDQSNQRMAARTLKKLRKSRGDYWIKQ